MRAVIDTLAKVADHDIPVLLRGESGTGKNFLAARIHAVSGRSREPFVEVDCATIPADLFESELFGHEKGTFTDASARKIGRLEAAGRGSVYFDEIAALTPTLQAKLLRVIEERQFTRLGGAVPVRFDARVISSTSAPLEDLLKNGAFRRDLLYRIEGVTVTVPPLRERREDILPLAREFLRGSGKQAPRRIDDAAAEMLRTYEWPGNVRELRNTIVRGSLVETSQALTTTALPLERIASPESLLRSARTQLWTLDQLEERYIREVLRQTRSNFSRAAEILGINRKTLLEKRRKYGIGDA